jgi:ketosteroid isomerase-like protein
MIGVVLGTGLIALVGAWLFFLRTTPPQPSGAEAPSAIVREKDQEKPAKSPSQSIITLPSPSPLPQVPEPDKSEPPSHDEALAKQLATVLQNLQEAQMKKDIFQYMKSYSNSFPELEQKREKTLKIWRLYDYGNLKFELGEVKSLDTDNAVAQVKWNIESHSQQTQKIETSMQTYTVWFIKDPEGWRIKRVEQLTSN